MSNNYQDISYQYQSGEQVAVSINRRNIGEKVIIYGKALKKIILLVSGKIIRQVRKLDLDKAAEDLLMIFYIIIQISFKEALL